MFLFVKLLTNCELKLRVVSFGLVVLPNGNQAGPEHASFLFWSESRLKHAWLQLSLGQITVPLWLALNT